MCATCGVRTVGQDYDNSAVSCFILLVPSDFKTEQIDDSSMKMNNMKYCIKSYCLW